MNLQKEMDYKQILQRFIHHLYHNPPHPATLEQAIQQTYLSKFHFYRLFKAVMGLTVNEFFKKITLQKAAKELLKTNPKIYTLAEKYGFNSTEVFTRNFKKEFHCTPRQFKTQHKHHSPQFQEIKPDFSTLKLELNASNGTITNITPIVHLQNLKLVGIQRQSNDNLVHTILPAIETFLYQADAIQHIANQNFYRICYDLQLIDGIPTFTELIARQVTHFENIPSNMVTKQIDHTKCIQFTHTGKLFTNTNCTVLNTYNMIYKYRIPAIGHQLTNDYFIEKYDHRFKGPFSEESQFSILMSIQ